MAQARPGHCRRSTRQSPRSSGRGGGMAVIVTLKFFLSTRAVRPR
jgi:hypothetical protein